METDYIKAHMVIERYVQGKLSDDEVVAFEERLLWDTALQEEVDLAEAMRNWFRESAKESKFTISEGSGGPRWIPNILLNPGYAAAASFVLGILVALPMLQGTDQATGFAVDASAPSVVVPLFATRSTNNDLPDIPVTPNAVTLVLVDVPYQDQTFNVIVRDAATGDTVWAQDSLSTGYLDAVAVGLPGAAAPPGEYTLTIESTGDAGFRQDLSFETVTSE